jgi:hypothetical protein
MNTTLQPTPKSLPITSLKPHPHNARTHNKRQIRNIADSIRAFGFIGHVLIDKDHQIIAGHGRVEAAKLLKLDDVPTLCVGHLTPEQLRAYMIADNRLAELAGWDEGLLAIEFQNFLQMDLDFDVSITGFDAPHIDMLIMKQQDDDADEEPPLEIDDAAPIVSRRGDLWVLGNHRVYCGDALEEQSYQSLMQGARAEAKNKSHAILFKGKLTDSAGNPFVTTYTKRGSKRYYYYLNKTSKVRIGVAEVNTIITNVTASLDVSRINLGVEKLSKAEISKLYPAAIDALVKQAITKVIIHEEKITLMLDKQKLAQSIADAKDGVGNAHPATLTHIEILEHSDAIEVTLNVVFRCYAGRKIGYSSTEGALNITQSNHDNALIRAIVRCHKWNTMLETQEATSIKEIAEKEGVERTYVGDVMKLKYLCPEITSMIMKGTQPRTLNLSQLLRQPLQLDWQAQKALLQIA